MESYQAREDEFWERYRKSNEERDVYFFLPWLVRHPDGTRSLVWLESMTRTPRARFEERAIREHFRHFGYSLPPAIKYDYRARPSKVLP